jgi:hypothetical protein
VFTVANIAPENASAALPAHSVAGTPTRADPSGNRRRTPCLALARLARRTPGQSLSNRHFFYPKAPSSRNRKAESISLQQGVRSEPCGGGRKRYRRGRPLREDKPATEVRRPVPHPKPATADATAPRSR